METVGQARRTSTRSKAGTRDLRIDFCRGLALVCIFADHIPGNIFANFTLTNFGFTDAAEVFVVLAGYAGFLAFSRPFKANDWRAGLAKVGARIRDLYVAHLAVLAVCAMGLIAAAWAFRNPLYLEHVNLTPVVQDPLGSIGRALLLLYQPGYLNILPLYVLLLLWLPALIWLMRINLGIALLASASLWVGSGVFEYNLPSYTDASGWLFDPFAWQFLFSLGAISADAASPDGPLRPRSRWLFCIATAYLLLGLLVAAPWTKIPGWDGARALPDFRHEVSKQYLSAWRLAGIVALAYVLASSVPPQAAWLRRRWAQLLISCGQNSLPVFCLSIVLSLTGFVILVEGGENWLLQIAVNAGGVAVLCFAAWKLRQLKRARRQDAQPAAATAPRCPTRQE